MFIDEARDLNGDGRDDILYRAWKEPSDSGPNSSCLGWFSRLSTGTGFGPPQYHGFSYRSDWQSCPNDGSVGPSGAAGGSTTSGQASTIYRPLTGDVFPVDIDRDGRVATIERGFTSSSDVSVGAYGRIAVPELFEGTVTLIAQ